MPVSPEVSGVAIVAAGAFNPAIFHPRWLSENGLIAENEAEHALEEVVLTPQFTAFQADWLGVQVTTEQAVFTTVEEAHELELRDLAKGAFDLLPHTPVDALGINADAHYQIGSQNEWHAIGDRFAPKDYWEETIFAGGQWKDRGDGRVAGMRLLRVEVWHEDGRDFVRVEVAPSVRVTPWGVYVGINSHFQLTLEEARGTGYRAARTVADRWDEARGFEHQIHERLAEVFEG